jgi:MFS family permease
MELTLRHNIRNIYWMFFFQSFMIIIAVFVPLLQRHGLTMAQVLQTQALFAFVVAVAEVPSGYLADLWGRKNTIIIGQGFIAFAYLWLLQADSFMDFLVYEGLMGIGISLSSGADLALLYDTQTALNEQGDGKEATHGKHISRIVAIEGYGGAASGIAASFLTLLGFDWVLWAQFFSGFISLAFALSLMEAPRRLSTESHSANIQKLFSTILFRPMVLWISLTIIVFGLLGLYSFWLLQKYWELQDIPVTWFGYLWATHCVIRGIVAQHAHEVEAALGWQKVFMLSAALPIISLFGMGMFSGWFGIAFALGLIVCRGLSTVVFYDALNSRVNGEFRATINSMVSLGTRGLFIVTGPLLGYGVDALGVNSTLLILATVLLPTVLAVLYFLSRHVRQEEELQVTTETELEETLTA